MTDTTPAPEGVTPEAVADLARRLRGEYRIPITDGLGPAGGEEPDNAHEFVRHFPSPPIQNDAATMIEALAADLAAQTARADAAESDLVRVKAIVVEQGRIMEQRLARAAAAEAKVARLVEALEKIAANDRRTNCRNGNINNPFHVDGPFGKIARAAIAEVQG